MYNFRDGVAGLLERKPDILYKDAQYKAPNVGEYNKIWHTRKETCVRQEEQNMRRVSIVVKVRDRVICDQ